jgi:quercetin dioxygenase-like cupin family protein
MASGESTSSATVPDLPNPTRLVTTVNLDTGVSSFNSSFDESLGAINNLGGSLFRLGYVSQPPPLNLEGADVNEYANYLTNPPPLVIPGGSTVVWYIDTPPGASSPMHRTISLDYVVVVSGELQLTLDSGEKRDLKPGDMVIQRGTAHQWLNTSPDKWVRMIGVMTSINPITLNNGTQLGVEGLG